MAIIRHRYNDYGAGYIQVAKYAVTYKDVFKLKPLYELLHKWLLDEGYCASKDEKFREIFYMSKEDAGGKEIWVRWRLGKNPFPPPQKQEFWRFDIDLDIHVLTLQDIELMIDNKKIKANKGEVEVTVVANLIKNWEKTWAKNPFLKIFTGFVQKKIFLRSTEERLKKQLYDDAYHLRDVINNFLRIETFMGTEKGGAEFWPKKLPE